MSFIFFPTTNSDTTNSNFWPIRSLKLLFVHSSFFNQSKIIWLVKKLRIRRFFCYNCWARNCFLILFSKIMPNLCRLVSRSLYCVDSLRVAWEISNSKHHLKSQLSDGEFSAGKKRSIMCHIWLWWLGNKWYLMLLPGIGTDSNFYLHFLPLASA